MGHRLNDWLAISANALAFNDQILAFDSDQEEEARAEYRDQYYWLRIDLGAADGLGGRVLAAQTALESERSGTADLPGVGSGALSTSRHFTINSFQADGWWRIGARSLLQAGLEWREQSGRYDYEDEAEFDAPVPDAGRAHAPKRTRSLHLRPSGHQAGAYLNWRFEPSPTIATDLGLRWDRATLAAARPVAMEPARGPHVAAARAHAPARSAGASTTRRRASTSCRCRTASPQYQPDAARDAPRREHRARPHGVPDAARRGLSQGLRPSVRRATRTC